MIGENKMIECKYLIIGAGISGLSFAVKKQKSDFLMLEKDSIPGGLCQSFYENGFVWDVAGHFFHFHSDKTKGYYEELMKGISQRTVAKCAKVYYDGQYIDAPFQYNIHQLPREEFLECLTGLYYSDCPEGECTFDEFVKKKYGSGIANKFLIPYNEKLYACKMNDLERNSMGSFLPKLDFEMLMNFYRGFKGNTYNDTFRYPVNGCVEIINALIGKLDGSRIKYNEAVQRIDFDKKIAYTNKEKYHYEFLVNTSSLNNFCRMIDCKKDVPLNFNQVLVLNIGFDKESIDKDVCWIYFPGNEYFYRVGFYNNIAGTDRLSVYVEIGYKANENIDIDIALSATLEDLKRVGITTNHKMIAYKSFIINPGYAHITTEGKVFTDKLIIEMESKDIYMIGRYARWQYSAMDDSIEQAEELANRI